MFFIIATKCTHFSMMVGRKASRSSQYTTTQMASINKSSQELDIKPAKATFEVRISCQLYVSMYELFTNVSFLPT